MTPNKVQIIALAVLFTFVCGYASSETLPNADEADHWSFQAIQDPPVPDVGASEWVRNEIDRFILSRLREKGFDPSPEADRYTLIRRLSLDLVGLPPNPHEVRDFVNDDSPHAYARLVNRLLASPHFGERWGRYWLDLARYADSDGFEKDTVRPHAWRYREWVIDTINRDLPYDRFVVEQLAGDLLPNATLEQKVATGFHRNTLTNLEGGVDQEEFRVEQVIDRVNTTSAVFMGLTMACVQCHDHKYDPLSQKDYYGLFAFFNSADEVDIPAPLTHETALYDRRMEDFRNRERELKRDIARRQAALKTELSDKAEELRSDLGGMEWTLLEPSEMTSTGGAEFAILEDGSVLVGGPSPPVDTYTIEVPTSLQGITAFRLEVLTHESLPKTGPGRARHGNFILTDFQVTSRAPGDPISKRHVKIAEGWTDFWEEGWPIEEAFDDDPRSGWSINAWQGYNNDRTAIFVTRDDIGQDGDQTLTFTLDHTYGTSHAIGRFRLYATTGSREHVMTPKDIVEIATRLSHEWSDAERERLFNFVGDQDPRLRELNAALDGLNRAKPSLEATQAQTLYERDEPRKTHILERGSFLNKGDLVYEDTPEVLPSLETERERPTRLDLAEWLVHADHPLTARVAANRVWERLFGAGLVLTSEDFGTRGEKPSHPELLDWLAGRYMEMGWSRKDLIRLIVSSATYRQRSTFRPDVADVDAANRLLARQNRYRVEAEIIRDSALAVSGLLNPTVGGPSVRPPMPEGIAELGYANSIKWPTSAGDSKYRRGMYIHFQRTVPYPMLMTFDCPDSNVTAIRRARSNTPLQALTLLNDPNFFECAQALGRRVAAREGEDVQERLRWLHLATLGREANEAELAEMRRLHYEQLVYIDENDVDPVSIAGDESATEETAAWVLVARAMMNLDAFITRE